MHRAIRKFIAKVYWKGFNEGLKLGIKIGRGDVILSSKVKNILEI